MGAGPNGEELYAAFNRTKDVSEKLNNPVLIQRFNKGNVLVFLDSIQDANEKMNYNFDETTLEYEALPGDSYIKWTEWDEYNSNSYISGILKWKGYPMPKTTVSLPGFNKPVPFFVFEKKFSNTSELEKEWKKHFPGF